jgi:hypothetical protein
MPNPDMDESAWRRAVDATAAVYGSTAFEIAFALVTAIVAAFAVLIGDGSTKDQIASAILIVASGMALVLFLVFAVQLALAPLQQRNELRSAWPTGPIREPVNVDLNLREFARKFQDLATKASEYQVLTPDFESAADKLAEEAVQFSSEHVPSQAKAFIELPPQTSFVRVQQARSRTLRSIADELARE